MPVVHVTDQSNHPVAGAFVTVSHPGVVDNFDTYYYTATTDASGNAGQGVFPEPGLAMPTGSTADVFANYTDPITGVRSAAQSTWTTDLFDNLTPDPLNMTMALNLTITPPAPPSIFPPGFIGAIEEGLLIVGGLAGLGIGVYIITRPGVLGGIQRGASALANRARKR